MDSFDYIQCEEVYTIDPVELEEAMREMYEEDC